MAYVTGLAMRRAADLYAGAAKTDPKDAAVLADYARRNTDRLTWTTPSDGSRAQGFEELCSQLARLEAPRCGREPGVQRAWHGSSCP